ncbi:alpha/beta hydrolase [Aureimonas endophytica]|uniref:Alpha/beta hydrolase n=1 Tax=Aureimonas endophytica TaxID=2027858 RepID=A0A916ZQG8_9HYPH|nr:alpha/beta hydrolase [Aureimonas endophytica]GGE07201.1 alpha/beta hydrolase [Aureimonas endophytica]
MLQVEAGDLAIAYLELGPTGGTAPPVILLHGFPYDVHAYGGVAARLAAAGRRCLVPYLRGYGATRFLSLDTPRSGQQAALGIDLLAFMDALAIPRAVLGGYDWGGRAACIVAALHPERVTGLVSGGTGYNIQNIPQGSEPEAPEAEHRFWYQYYFHSERGRRGLSENRRELCRYIWRLWSPSWTFDAATFDATARAFDNPDFVEIVIHSYRHRFGGVAGDPRLDAIEARLAAQPPIAVPTIALHGADDGVDPPSPEDTDATHFTGPYQQRIVPGAGHNLPQEAPDAFADALLAVG